MLFLYYSQGLWRWFDFGGKHGKHYITHGEHWLVLAAWLRVGTRHGSGGINIKLLLFIGRCLNLMGWQ
jgi:hypothetical protein